MTDDLSGGFSAEAAQRARRASSSTPPRPSCAKGRGVHLDKPEVNTLLVMGSVGGVAAHTLADDFPSVVKNTNNLFYTP